MNHKYKKLIAASTIATLAVPVAVSANTHVVFKDIKEDAYYAEAVQNLAERGVISGYTEDQTFRPNEFVTRAQAAKIIAGVLKMDVENVENPQFKDVPTTHPHYAAIAALANAGIINGYKETQTFKPNEPMTRHQMAKVIALAFKLPESSTKLPFTDVAGSYENYVKTLYSNQITTGTTSSTFGGNEFVKRGQLATFVYRAEGIKQQPPVVNEQAVSGEVTAITADTITIAEKAYTIPSELKYVLNDTNKAAFEKALIQATVKGDTLVAVNELTIRNEGTKEQPIKLQSVLEPVASVDVVAQPVWNVTIIVDTPFADISKLHGPKIQVTEKVQQLNLANMYIPKLDLLENSAANIQGSADIEELHLASTKVIQFDVKGTAQKFTTELNTAALTLSKAFKIENFKATTSIQAIISNYAEVKANIIHKNDGKIEQATSTPSYSGTTAGNGGTTLATVTKTGTIDASSSSKVTIDGQNYVLAANVATLFNNASLQGAQITVEIENNKVTKVTALTITQSGEIKANGVTIHGNVTIAADHVTLQGATVTGNVTLKQQVQTAVNFDNVTIKGTVITEPTIATKYRGLVASLTPMKLAETTVTRLKITFANSMVGFVEIKTTGTALNMTGTTSITMISLEANGSILASKDVVLPNLKISKGVTEIQLNASIASVEIETNTDLKVSGKGNFDSVKIKTEKAIEFKTEGTIKELATNTANVTLGTEIKVRKTKDLAGNTKPAQELIQNLEEVKDNVNVEIIIDNETKPIAAKLMEVPGKLGYATISVVNGEGKKLKYRQVPYLTEGDIVAVGSKAPTNAKDYKAGDEFIAWFSQDVQVYVVDENDIVLDAYEIDRVSTNTISISTYKIENNKIIYKSVHDPNLKTEAVYFADKDNFLMIESKELSDWYLDEKGIPTTEFNVPDWLTTDNSKYAKFVVKFIGLSGGRLEGHHLGQYSDRNEVEVYALNQLLSIYNMDNSNARIFVSSIIDHLASNEIEVKDLDGNHLYTKNESVANYNLFELYVADLKENKYSTAEQIKNAVLAINNNNVGYEKKLQEAESAVLALYKDKSNSNQYDRLKTDITEEEITSAEKLVNALIESKHKDYLLSNIDSIRKIYSDLQKAAQLLSWAHAYKTTPIEEKSTLRNDIFEVVYKFSYEIGSNEQFIYQAENKKFDAYLEKLLLLDQSKIPSQSEILALVKQTNMEQENLQIAPSGQLKFTGSGYELTLTFNEAIELDGNVQLELKGSLAGANYLQPTIVEDKKAVMNIIFSANVTEVATVTLKGGIKTASGEVIPQQDIIVNLVQ